MKRLWEHLIVTGCGAATSYATAFIIWKFDITFHSTTLAYVVPIGAITFGFLGALGYYWGLKLIGHRPAKFLGFTIVLVAASTYFLIYWLDYYNWEENGVRLRNHMEFSEYLDHRLRNTAVKSYRKTGSSSESDALGDWGYAWGLLQVAGFSLGGFFVFGRLRSQHYCDRCSRYFGRIKWQHRVHDTLEDGQRITAEISRLLDAGEFQAAIAYHAAVPKKTLKQLLDESGVNDPVTLKSLIRPAPVSTKSSFSTTFHTQCCPTCAHRFLSFQSGASNEKGDSTTIATWETFTEQPVEIG